MNFKKILNIMDDKGFKYFDGIIADNMLITFSEFPYNKGRKIEFLLAKKSGGVIKYNSELIYFKSENDLLLKLRNFSCIHF